VNDSTSTVRVADVSDAALDTGILDWVTGADERLTPLALKRRARQVYGPLRRGRIASSIKRLVEKRAIVYTYQLGNSFLEPSFEKPVRVADMVVLKPPAYTYDALPDDVVVNIKAGAAFGTGCHPTTRLALTGLETVCTHHLIAVQTENGRVLDIGTGSGVLAIAALKMGLDQGIGLDIDPCARAEALENAVLNGLSKRLTISGRSLDSLAGRFLLITANLRLPTLKAYLHKMAQLIVPEGFLIVSGIRSDEIETLKEIAAIQGLTVCWEGRALGWGALVLRQRANARVV
jgi:ribosomal protein L11 methyltransferase